MKKFFKEFKEFINKGNVVDMAVGVLIGTMFKSIVDSLVKDMISPLMGLIVKVDFSELAVAVGGVNIAYGAFIMTIINFLINAFVLFWIVKFMNIFKKKTVPEAKKVKCPYCQGEISALAVRCPHCTSHLIAGEEISHKA